MIKREKLDYVLERTFAYARAALPSSLFANDIELVKDDGMIMLRDFCSDDLIVACRQWFMRTIPEVFTVSYPADWKEAIKDRFYTEEEKAADPVRYRHFRVEKYAAYPSIPCPEPLMAGDMIRDEGFPMLDVTESTYLDPDPEDQ